MITIEEINALDCKKEISGENTLLTAKNGNIYAYDGEVAFLYSDKGTLCAILIEQDLEKLKTLLNK